MKNKNSIILLAFMAVLFSVVPAIAETETFSYVVITSESGTCKFCVGGGGCDGNTTYDQMGSTFETTGGTTHTQSFTWTRGVSYSLYFSCRNTGGAKTETKAAIFPGLEKEVLYTPLITDEKIVRPNRYQ